MEHGAKEIGAEIMLSISREIGKSIVAYYRRRLEAVA
jgi:hypothetical protein